MTERLALVGPTASGKSTLSLDLAERFGAEILCVDSMTVYRGMDIGTAKPSPEDRARVPHHLLDLAAPAEPFTAARFQAAARDAIAGVEARGKIPLFAGGSGLYLRAALDDLTFPPTDPAVRARLEQEDSGVLGVRLKELDPEAATFVDLANRRRVVRALEVIEITGRPFSAFRSEWERYQPAAIAGLDVSADELDRRIRARLRAMLDAGLPQEVGALLGDGYRDALTATQAIPYRDAIALIEGAITQDEFLEEAARATRRLARRQISWFRRDPRVTWFAADEVERAQDRIAAYYSQHLEG